MSTILVVIAILALAGGIFFFGTMYARGNAYGPGMMSGMLSVNGYSGQIFLRT